MNIILLLTFVCGADIPQTSVKLIAHRGIMDEQHDENSLGGLQEAIRRGFWMVEVDVVRAKDGEPIVNHDKNFARIYGSWENVADLPLREIRRLRSLRTGERPSTFEEFVKCAKGKTLLMVDTKEKGTGSDFFERIEQILKDNDMLDSTFFIGSGEQKAYFNGKGRIDMKRDGIEKAIQAGEPVSSRYFIFEHGKTLDEATVKYAASVNVPVVASVNALHYRTDEAETGPKADIQRLLSLGVIYFQIDSAYAKFFPDKTAAPPK